MYSLLLPRTRALMWVSHVPPPTLKVCPNRLPDNSLSFCLPTVESFGPLKICCEQGMRYIPKSMTCLQFAKQIYRKYPRCREAFTACCEFVQQNLDQNLVLGRYGQSGLLTSQTQHTLTVGGSSQRWSSIFLAMLAAAVLC